MALVDRKVLDIPIHIYRANSERWTFECSTVRSWAEERLDGRVLNACAGETQLRHPGGIVRNDVNDDRPADYHTDLRELPELLESSSFDTVVFDPPWSVYQVNDKYEGRGQDTIKQSTQMARAIDELLTATGKALSFGYTLDMIPSSMNYTMAEAAVFTIPGPGKDFFGVVHQRENHTLTTIG